MPVRDLAAADSMRDPMMMLAAGSGPAMAAVVSVQRPVGCHLDRDLRFEQHNRSPGYGGNDYGNPGVRRIEVAFSPSPHGETA